MAVKTLCEWCRNSGGKPVRRYNFTFTVKAEPDGPKHLLEHCQTVCEACRTKSGMFTLSSSSITKALDAFRAAALAAIDEKTILCEATWKETSRTWTGIFGHGENRRTTMAKPNDGGPAYPCPVGHTKCEHPEGMTLLDYFAAGLLKSLVVGPDAASRARNRYNEAAAMIAEKRRRETADEGSKDEG